MTTQAKPKRPAHRPPLPATERRHQVNFRLHPSTIAALKTIADQTAFIEATIRAALGLPQL